LISLLFAGTSGAATLSKSKAARRTTRYTKMSEHLSRELRLARALEGKSAEDRLAKADIVAEIQQRMASEEAAFFREIQAGTEFESQLKLQDSRARTKLENMRDQEDRAKSLAHLRRLEADVKEASRDLTPEQVFQDHGLFGHAVEVEVARLADYITRGELVGFEKKWARRKKNGTFKSLIGEHSHEVRKVLGEWDVETRNLLIEVTVGNNGKSFQKNRIYLSPKTNSAQKPVVLFMPLMKGQEVVREIDEIRQLHQPARIVRTPGQLIQLLQDSTFGRGAVDTAASFPWEEFPLLRMLELRHQRR
jgi:hypothetical protein